MKISFPPVAEQMDALKRSALEIISEGELERKLERSLRDGKALRIKQGFDPTRADLHIGHAVSIRQLRIFQELGHEVVFVVGDYTALIGDPTGRSELRPRLSEAEVAANARTYEEQVFQILDADRTTVEYNSRWLKPLKLEDVLKLTSHYTVARMIEREDFSNRFKEGRPISLVEFMYPLLQAYDSVALRADVELGGSDQKFNLLVARAIQERYGQEPQVCLLMPLLRGTDGVQKMSKSYDNYVGLSMPADEQFGRTMSIPDDLLAEWYRLVSGLEQEVLTEKLQLVETAPYQAKRDLAALVVQQHHGQQASVEAVNRFDLIHRERGVPEDVPLIDLSADDPGLGAEGGEVWLPRLLVHTGLAPSTSQAGRLVQQGAISVDGQRVEERQAKVSTTGEVLLQRGKRHFARVRFS